MAMAVPLPRYAAEEVDGEEGCASVREPEAAPGSPSPSLARTPAPEPAADAPLNVHLVSPTGKPLVVVRAKGRAFSARPTLSSLRSGGTRKRARLSRRPIAGRRARVSLYGLVARDKSVRDCTEEERKEALRVLSTQAAAPVATLQPTLVPTVPTPKASDPPDASQSIIGAALAEAGKGGFQFGESTKGVEKSSPAKPAAPAPAGLSLGALGTPNFGAGAATTPLPSFSAGGFSAGSGGSSSVVSAQRRKGRRKR